MSKIKEVIKPILIFTAYITLVALLSNMIGIYFNTDISIVSAGVFIVAYPVYIFILNFN